jgi:hypothetical protein
MPNSYTSDYAASSKAKPKPKSVRPKNVNKNIKVSQSEINSIKKLGMKKALEIAGMNKGSEQAGAVASFAEGVRRLYGETRYQNAVYTPKASPGPIGSSSSVREGRAPAPKPKPKPSESRSNVREGRVAAAKPAAKKPMTPYQKDMARRGIYNA